MRTGSPRMPSGGESDAHGSSTEMSGQLSGSGSRSDQGSDQRREKRKKLQNKSLTREDSMRSGRNSDSFESFSGSVSGPVSGSGHLTSGGGELFICDGLPGSSGGSMAHRQISPEQHSPDASVLECNAALRRMKITSNKSPCNGAGSQGDSDVEELPEQVHVQGIVQESVSPERLIEIEATVRRDGKGNPTSLGSENHSDSCKACLFVFTSVGCQNGVLCPFCHFKHKRGDRPRPCKGKRNRYRKLLARTEIEDGAPEGQSGACASQAAGQDEEQLGPKEDSGLTLRGKFAM